MSLVSLVSRLRVAMSGGGAEPAPSACNNPKTTVDCRSVPASAVPIDEHGDSSDEELRALAPPCSTLRIPQDSFEAADDVAPLPPMVDEAGRHSSLSPRPPLTPEELAARVLAQAHFYFGDINYPQDRFLRSLAREHPEHFIPLATVASFKKIRKLTEDLEVIANALATSDVVTLSADRTLIKRRHPLPHSPEDSVYRTLVVENVPPPVTADMVGRWCAKAGRIICSSNFDPARNSLPAAVKALLSQGAPSTGSSPPKLHPAFRPNGLPVVLVEYEDFEDAVKAIDRLSIAAEEATDWRHEVRMSIMLKKEKKHRKRKNKSAGSEEHSWSRDGAASVPIPYMHDRRHATRTPVLMDGTVSVEPLHPEEGKSLRPHIMNLVGEQRQRSSSWGSSSQGFGGPNRRYGALPAPRDRPDSRGSSDWRHPGSRTASPLLLTRDPGASRAPKGPDGSRGFGAQTGRGRGSTLIN